MTKRTIKSIVFSLIMVMGISTAAFADEMNMAKGAEKSIDGIKAELSFNDETVKTGKDDIMITLHDSNGKEIENATVTITAEMPDAQSMNMKDTEPVKVDLDYYEKGQYMGTINFTDKGKWVVTSEITVQGEKKDVDFDVDVKSSGPNWLIIGGFVGVVAIIIIVAAVKKRQAVKA